MTSPYHQLLAHDASLVANELGDHDAGGHALTATYRVAATGEKLTVTPTTRLSPLNKQGEDRGRTTADEIEVHIPRAQLPAVDEGKDTIKLQLPGDPAATPKWRTVARILEADAGFWVLDVGR